jgi:hypothetical protein
MLVLLALLTNIIDQVSRDGTMTLCQTNFLIFEARRNEIPVENAECRKKVFSKVHAPVIKRAYCILHLTLNAAEWFGMQDDIESRERAMKVFSGECESILRLVLIH